MSLESPRTPSAPAADAPVSANPSLTTNGAEDPLAPLPEARALGSPSPATNGEREPLRLSRGPGSSSRLPRPRQWTTRRKIVTVRILGLLTAGLVVAATQWWTR